MRGKNRRGSFFWPAFLFVAIVLIAAIPGGSVQAAKERPQRAEIPSPETIEERLFVKLNEERTARGLPRVGLSPDLVRLARIQSLDMAGRGILTHESAGGKSLKERLDDAGVLYRTSGENVARSGSFLAALIHESFLNSPGHRENVLNPEFDEVGIGVVLSADSGYFITVDFLASLTPKSDEEVRSFILGRLNEARKRVPAPEIALIPEADGIAASYAGTRSSGREVEANPEVLGLATVHFMMGPDLEEIAGKLAGRASTSAPAGGIGSWFGRTAEYPSGAYYVCLILLHDNPSQELRSAQMTAAVLEAANGARRALSFEPLVMDSAMSDAAKDFLKKAKPRAAPSGAWVAVYETQALSAFPESVRSKLEDKAFGRIGLAIVRNPGKGLTVTYTVAVLLGL